MEDRFKFRAWDKERKIMRFVGKHNCILILNKDEWELGEMGMYDLVLNHTTNRKNGILMQSTGLKDKNGKLIYEGDIFKDLVNNCVMVVCYGKIEKKVISEYDKSERKVFIQGFYFDDISNKKISGVFKRTHNESENWEVIGDINTNPELLTNNKEK